MNRREVLLDKARRSPNGLKFREFERLLQHCGWTQRRQRGSHRIWYSPNGYRLIIQPDQSMAKGYQVRQFLKQYNQEEADAEE
ncbi:MAG: type II toxin-antitoxin system HicA family toxin [Candidatus Poribacteria bacterium]|nr:type II toxin-antitoxin system HicA family toxin [Candidatus Poribacteria bacterium]